METPEKKMSLEPNAVVYPLAAHPRCYLGLGKVTPITGDEEEDRFKASTDLIGLAISSKAIIDDCLQTYVRDVVFFQIVGKYVYNEKNVSIIFLIRLYPRI